MQKNIIDRFINEKYKQLVMLQLVFFIYSFSGVFAKLASNQEMFSIDFMKYYFIEILILGIHAVLWQQILKSFDLTVAYSHFGMTIIWNFIWSYLFFYEKITLSNIIGSVIIILGIMLVVNDDQ